MKCEKCNEVIEESIPPNIISGQIFNSKIGCKVILKVGKKKFVTYPTETGQYIFDLANYNLKLSKKEIKSMTIEVK